MPRDRKDMKLGAIIFGSLVVAASVVTKAHADIPRGEGVRKGAELRDVLAAWGEPAERIDRSVKKELVWRYPKGAYVVFKEGKVTSFKTAVDPTETVREKKKGVASTSAPIAMEKDAAPGGDSKDMLRDIVREIPSGADGPYSDSSAGASGATSGLIPNPVPPVPGNPGQVIVPGQVVPSLDEEQD
jgi:hypothetical protein